MKSARQFVSIAVLAGSLFLPRLTFAQFTQHEGAFPNIKLVRYGDQRNKDKNDRVQNNAPRPGRWLHEHWNEPPQQQQRDLQRDPDYQRLTPDQQQHLRERLNQFNSLPPDQRQRLADRLRAMESLPPDKQQLLRNSLQQFRQMPDDRRRMLRHAYNSLRQMPPDQQQQVLNSDRFRSQFSDQERDVVRGLLDSGFNPGENPR